MVSGRRYHSAKGSNRPPHSGAGLPPKRTSSAQPGAEIERLATLNTDLRPRNVVPELCSFRLADPLETTVGDLKRRPPSLQQLQAVQSSQNYRGQPEKNTQENSLARVINTQRDGRNSIEKAKNNSFLPSKQKDFRTLEKVPSKVQRKSRAEIKTVPLSDYQNGATLVVGIIIKATPVSSLEISKRKHCDRTDSACPEDRQIPSRTSTLSASTTLFAHEGFLKNTAMERFDYTSG